MKTFVVVAVAFTLTLLSARTQEANKMNFDQLLTNCTAEIEHRNYTALKKVKVLNLEILAWYRIRDSRPLYVDNALCWAKVASEQGTRWVLVHMARNPENIDSKWRNADPSWHSYYVYDAPNAWFLYFDRPPNNDDIYKKMTFFEFKIDKNWELYDSKVLDENWKTAIGNPPTMKFSKKP